MKNLLIILSFLFVLPVTASAVEFPTCYDFRGLKVEVLLTNSEKGGPAFSTWADNGLPVIVFNPEYMEYISHSRTMDMFTFLHECGHHRLGHIANGRQSSARSHEQELAADCFAGKFLKKMGASPQQVENVLRDVVPWRGGETHPAGRTRIQYIAYCYQNT